MEEIQMVLSDYVHRVGGWRFAGWPSRPQKDKQTLENTENNSQKS